MEDFQHSSNVASIYMHILKFQQQLHIFRGQKIPPPLLIASQLTNYPKMWLNLYPSNSSTAHSNIRPFCVFFPPFYVLIRST